MFSLVFFLEEPSAKAMLEGLLPRVLPENWGFKCVPFEGKQDLHKQLPIKLRGWQTPNTFFVVIRDQDKADCRLVKAELQKICLEAGHSDVLVRIACHELESWYLGDLAAVEQGLGLRGLVAQQNQAKFRDPDRLSNAAEELKKLTNGQYQKVRGSRAIAPYLNLANNKSHSFRVLLHGLQRLIEKVTL